MSNPEREYWDCGDATIFRPSKDRCQKFVMAMLLCRGQIHDSFSLGVNYYWHETLGGNPRAGETKYNMKPHELDIVFRISLPKGMKAEFERIMGEDCLTEPPKVHMNVKPAREPNPRGDCIVPKEGDIKRVYDLAPPPYFGVEPNIRQDGKWLASNREEVQAFLDGKREFPRHEDP